MAKAEAKTKPTHASVDAYLADLDLGVLEALVVGSLSELERLHPADPQARDK